jgi:hypothetical protein
MNLQPGRGFVLSPSLALWGDEEWQRVLPLFSRNGKRPRDSANMPGTVTHLPGHPHRAERQSIVPARIRPPSSSSRLAGAVSRRAMQASVKQALSTGERGRDCDRADRRLVTAFRSASRCIERINDAKGTAMLEENRMARNPLRRSGFNCNYTFGRGAHFQTREGASCSGKYVQMPREVGVDRPTARWRAGTNSFHHLSSPLIRKSGRVAEASECADSKETGLRLSFQRLRIVA